MSPFFLLKLLALPKAIVKFFVDNWKIIVPILVFIILAFFVNRWYNNKLEEAFNAGHKEAIEEVRLETEKQNKLNRDFEERLNLQMGKFTSKVTKDIGKRTGSYEKLTKNLEKIILNNERYRTCKVDQEVTEARNKVRELGPKQ